MKRVDFYIISSVGFRLLLYFRYSRTDSYSFAFAISAAFALRMSSSARCIMLLLYSRIGGFLAPDVGQANGV